MSTNKKQDPKKSSLRLFVIIFLAGILILGGAFVFWKMFSVSEIPDDSLTKEVVVLDEVEMDSPVLVNEPALEEVASPFSENTEEGAVVLPVGVKRVSYTTAENLVNQYFKSYNEQDFKKACSMMDQDKCNADRPQAVLRFAEEYGKMEKGYESVRLWSSKFMPEDFHSQVVCVENKYRYKDDLEQKEVIETMSFYVVEREDGSDEISQRVCESKILSDGREGNCPVEAVKKFCVGE
jgi:hypothetical protein